MTDETIAGADSGNQYGDYNSLSIFANQIFPSWTDRRSGARKRSGPLPSRSLSSPFARGGVKPPRAVLSLEDFSLKVK